MHVRNACFDDIPRLVEIEQCAMSFCPVSYDCFVQRLVNYPEGLLVAEVGCVIIGYLYLIRLDMDVAHNWEIDTGRGTGSTHRSHGNILYGVTLATDRLGYGVAQALLKRAQDMVVEAGTDAFWGHSRLPGFSAWYRANKVTLQLKEALPIYLANRHDWLVNYYVDRCGLRTIKGIVDYSDADEASLTCAAWLAWP